MNMKRFWFSAYAICPVLVISFLVSACLLVERENPDDPKSDNFEVSARVNPASGATVSGHEEIVVTFSDPMDIPTVTLSGTIGAILETGNKTWSSVKFDNDTLTLNPNPDDGPLHVWSRR